jgi:hypothetical protein
MPKKKLTKAQVKKKIITAKLALYDLFMDKFNYGTSSFMPMSTKKLEEIYFPLLRALNKLKK